MNGRHGRQLVQTVPLAPARETAHGLEVSPARVLVADVGREEFPEARGAARRQEEDGLLLESRECTGRSGRGENGGGHPAVPRNEAGWIVIVSGRLSSGRPVNLISFGDARRSKFCACHCWIASRSGS